MLSDLQPRLVAQLNRATDFQRLPKRIRASYKVAQLPPAKQTTGGIFLAAGFQAWLSFFLLSNAVLGKAKYDGKAADRDWLLRLEKLAIEEKRALASAVLDETLDQHVLTKVAEWERICLLDSHLATTLECSAISMTEHQSTAPGELVPAPLQHATVLTDRDQAVPQPAQGDAPAASDRPGQVFEGDNLPQCTKLARLFPPYLCGAVVTVLFSTAMVHMTFPDNPSDDCRVTLSILPNKVEYLAMTLFGIHLESDGERRYVVLDSGSFIAAPDQLHFEGVREDACMKIFGPEMNKGVQSSFKRAMEFGSSKSRCISMSIRGTWNGAASLSLVLGLEQGLHIRQILFG